MLAGTKMLQVFGVLVFCSTQIPSTLSFTLTTQNKIHRDVGNNNANSFINSNIENILLSATTTKISSGASSRSVVRRSATPADSDFEKPIPVKDPEKIIFFNFGRRKRLQRRCGGRRRHLVRIGQSGGPNRSTQKCSLPRHEIEGPLHRGHPCQRLQRWWDGHRIVGTCRRPRRRLRPYNS